MSSDKKVTVYILLNFSVLFFGNCTQENSPKDKPHYFRLVSFARCSAISSSTKSTHKILQRTLPLASNKDNFKTVETRSGLICGDRFFWIGTYDSCYTTILFYRLLCLINQFLNQNYCRISRKTKLELKIISCCKGRCFSIMLDSAVVFS